MNHLVGLNQGCIPKISFLFNLDMVKICRDWFFWVMGLGLSKPIIQPTQLGFGLSLAGVWQILWKWLKYVGTWFGGFGFYQNR